METLNLFSSWLFSVWKVVADNVFTEWGFFGTALFCIPLLRKLIKIFKNTF